MNKIFKVIWSKSKQCYIVVSEMAKNHSGKKKIVVASILAAMAVGADISVSVHAVDEGTAKPGGVAIGSGSYAGSDGSIALGKKSYAVGTQRDGTTDPSIAIGQRAVAIGNSSLAVGLDTDIRNSYAVAVGRYAKVDGDYGIGMGYKSMATEHATAVGESARSRKMGAAAYGVSARGYSQGGVAIGFQSLAGANTFNADGTPKTYIWNDDETTISNYQKWGDVSVGLRTVATGGNATALGRSATATAANSIAIGGGDGNASDDNKEKTQASAEKAAAIGYSALASGKSASALGTKAKATAENASAVGTGAEATAKDTFAAGTGAAASEVNATALGKGAAAEKADAIAIGTGATSGGTSGIAMGNDAQAQAADTIAVGSSSRASNDNDSAFGNAATAAGSGSTAIGYQANTTAANSTAIGAAAQSTKASATALGNGAKAFSTSGIAIGEGATVGVAEGRTTAGTTPAVDASNSIAIGKNAKVLAGSGSIALGANTQITASDVGTSSGAAQKTYPYMLTNTQGTDAVADKENGIVAIGTKRSSADSGFARRLTGVAGGVNDYDAVNLKQAKAIESSLKKGERHIKATSYTPNGSGTITLNYVNGENTDVTETATITDVAKKSDEWTLGIKTTTTTGTKTTSSVSNITPTAPSGSTKKVISLEAGKNIAIDANGNNVKISTTGLDFLSVKSDATANKAMNVRSDITLKTNRDNDGATGQHSVAIGAYAEARNLSSTAIGNEVLAANNYATALGYDVANSGEGAVAIGKKVNSGTNFSTTIGYHQSTIDRASASVNIGYQSTVKSNQSVAIGSTIGTETAAQYSVAIGYKAKTLGKNAIAIGSSNDGNEVTAGAENSIAIGTSARVLAGQGSVAIGWGTEVGADDVKSSARASDADKVYPYLLDKSSGDEANDAGNGVVAIGKKRSSGDGQTIARRLTGLAGAVGDYDAVNLKQLKALESNEWLLRTQDGDNATPTDVTPASVQGETKKRVTLKAGDNIAIENNNGTVTIKAKDVVTSITSGNTTALTVSPSKGAVTITPNIASAVGAANEDGKLVTSGSVKTALDAKIDKTAEMHIKTGEYTVGTDGNASLIQQNGNNQDQSTRVVIKDIAKKSVVDGINTTVNTHTSQIANLTTMVGGKVSQTDFDTFKAQPITFTGDDNAGVARTLGTTLTVKGGANYTSTTPNTNIQVVKDGSTGADGLLVKLSDKLSGMKEIAGDGTNDLIIKNGDTKVTVKAPKDGNTGSIDFGDTKLVASNLDASIKYRANDDTAANAKSVKLADGFNYVASNDATTTAEGPKSGLAITAEENGKVTFGLDKDTRSKVDNAADKNLSNLSEAGNNKITNLAKAAAKETVKVADGINTKVDTDTTTTEGVTTYKVNANDTKVAIAGDGLTISGGDLGATDRVRTYTLDLSNATKGKLTAIGGLATVIGGTSITNNGTVTGPTFNITKAEGGTETAKTLKDAIDKLNKTNEGQNTTISNLTNTVTNNYNDLSTKITNAGTAATTAATTKGLNFTGDDTTDNGKVHRDLGETLTIKGGENFARGTSENNIKVVKNNNDLDVKLAENLGNIKEIAGDGKNDLVIKNGDTKVTVKAPKDGNTGSIDFGDTKLVASNLDASIKYRANDDAAANAKSVKLADGFNYVASNDATTTAEGPKSGLAITAEDNGKVTFGLDKATREKVDNAADKNLSNLSEAGNNKITNLAKAAAKETVKVAPGINTTVDTDTTTTEGVTTYKVNANDTKVAIAGDGLAISGGDLGATDRVRAYTLDLSDATKGKLTAVGNLANVIGGTTIATDGTVTGPTFNITNATGGTDTANTLKDAIDKLNTTNEGQNTAITKLGDTVTKNYNTLSDKIDKAGETATNALTEKGLDFYGNKDAAETDKVHRNLGQALKVKGAENFTREATATNNIDVVKNTAGDGFDVKLAENLGNIKEIAGDGTHDLVIKNGDTKVTVKAPKDGNTGSIDFGDTKLVTNNLDANISYKAGTETDKKTVKLQDGFNFVAGTGTVAPKHLEAGTASPTEATDSVEPKKGIAISTAANGVVNIGLDSDTRGAIDNAASKDYVATELANLNTTITGNANLNFAGNVTKDAQDADVEKVGLALAKGTLHIKGDATDITTTAKGDTVTIGLTPVAQGKLAAVGNLANVIGGTTITTDGTVTGPTFNITNAAGGTDTATTLKDAIDKLNATNEGQNTAITKLGDTVTKNYNSLSDKIDKAGETATNALTAKGLDFYGNKDAAETDKVHRNLGEALKVKGAENFTREATATNNIDVVKNTAGDGFDVKLAENLGNIKEISGDGTHDLVIKNGDTKVTVKAPKDGNTGSIDFGDTKLVTNNLDANISYKAGTETDKKTVKLQDGFNFVAGTGTVAPKHLEAGTASPTEATDSVEPKKGIAISTAANGVVNIGLDSDTRGAIDNAADKNLSNLSDDGNNKITNLAKAAAKEVVKVAPGINTTVDEDTTTTAGVTTYKVNANDTKVAIAGDGLSLSGGDLGTTDRVRTYTLDLSDATKGKLTAVGGLATVIGGTTITENGTVTGPTFNITKAEGGTDPVNTLKDAVEKLDATNKGQNEKITNLGNSITEKGLDFYGNKDTESTDKVHRNLGEALKVKGAENFTRVEGAKNNIDVVKNTAGDGFDVKLAENLGNIKEIAGDGTNDLVIKNGDTKVTVKAPKDGNKGSIDFGDTKLVTNNLEADMTYRANSAPDTEAKSVKLQKGLNFVAGTGTVTPKNLAAGTASPTATTDEVTPKKGIVISTEADGVVNIGLDNDTRSAIDNAANQDLSNLTTAGKKVITDAAQGSVKVAAGKNITVDPETKDNVTTYTVNANDTLVTSDNTLVTVNGGTLGEDKVRTYTLGLSTAVTDKLAQLSAKNADGRDGKLGSETDAIASAGIAKADGLNGETATYKVNALRHGEAGSVVYTDANGNRIVKATDGNYYKATEVNANGVVKTLAENNGIAPEAVDKATIVATLVNANGTTAPAADDANKVATTKLTNIKEAAITATSNDAVTGRQLHGLKSDLATALGGGSTVDANGSFTGPTYNITKDDGTNTSDPVNNVGDAITKLDTRINNTNTTLSTKGLDFYGNKDTADTDKVHRNLGEALKVKGAENFTRTGTNNIDVVKNTVGDGFDVKLAENLGNIKEIAGDGKTDLVIKNGDATITVKPGKAGSTDPDTGTVTPPTNPSVDFGNTTLVVKNIEADITYRANSAEDADAHTVKLKKGLNFVAGTGTVAPKNLEAGTASPTATTDSVVTKKGIAISTDVDGVVNIGLDNDTRSAIDNAANQDLSNLTTAGKKVITDAAQGAVKVAAGNNVTVDTETKDNVTKYTVNGRDTTVKAADNGSVSVTGGTLNDKGEREYTVDLTDATKAQINRIDGIDTRLTTAEGNITILQGDMTQAKQDITILQGDMTKAKADIVTNAGNIATNAGNIVTNKANITKNAGDIAINTANITKNAGNITINATNIGKNAEAIQALQGNSAKKDLSNLTNAGKDVVTGLVNVVGTNGITVTNATDDTSRVKTFTAKLDDKVTFGKDGNKITIDGTTGMMTAPNATINVVNTKTVQVGDTNTTNTAVTSEGVTVTTKQPDGKVTSTVIIKDGTVSGLTNTKWDPAKVTDTDRSKAATQGQMKDVSDTLQKGRVFAADTGVASTTVALGDTLAIKGGANGRLTDNNIGVELTAATAKEPATMTVRLAKDVKMKDGSTTYEYYLPEFKPGTVEPVKNPDGTVKYKTDAKGNPIPLVITTVNGEGITITPVKELNKPSVTLTADGLDNGGNAIHNVGPGTAPNDAATVGQVSAAASVLQNKVHTVGAHAAALAAMNPLSYDPLKKSQVMAGYGAYKGNNAVALGVAHYANEDTLFNVGVSVGNGENMVNAGMTYRFGGEDSMIPERYKGGPISSVYVMQDEITALKAENARKDAENAKKEAENEEMKAQIKMLIERVTMLEAKK